MRSALSMLAAIVLLTGLPLSPVVAGEAILLLYQVSEPGIDSYQSRILITPTHLRVDEGSDDYTLFDREQDIIYGVSRANRSILVVDPPPGRPLPKRLLLRDNVVVDERAPLIAGHRPNNVALLVNGQICTQLVAVPGLLREAVVAMQEFQALLGRAQQATVDRIPADQQSDCELADLVYAPVRPLQYGLPIQQQRDGYSRFLVDFSARTPVEDGLFALPSDYARMAMPLGE